MADVKAIVALIAVKSPGDFIPRHFKLTTKSPTILVGRSSSKLKSDRGTPSATNAYFDCPVVSRKHAELSLVGRELVLNDLNSLHGTSVNGKRIRNPEILKIGDIVSIGNNVADGPLHFHATIFKIDYKIIESARLPVVDLSSPVASPIMHASKSIKPVVSSGRVVWDEVEISPSPSIKPTITVINKSATGGKRANFSTYSVPEADSDVEDDEVVEVLSRSQTSHHATAPIQSSVTDAELLEVADDIELDDMPTALSQRRTSDAGKSTDDVRTTEHSDISEDQESEFISSDESSASDSCGSESPPSSELEFSSPVRAPKATSEHKPIETSHFAAQTGEKVLEMNTTPHADVLANFDFQSFLGEPAKSWPGPPANTWKSDHSNDEMLGTARPQWEPPRISSGYGFYPPPPALGYPGRMQHLYPSSLPPPPAPPQFPYNEPHPFYPVNGIPSGLEPRDPSARTRQYAQDLSSESQSRPSELNSRSETKDTTYRGTNDQQHAALRNRVAINSIISKPDVELTKDTRGAKRDATAMEGPIELPKRSSEVVTHEETTVQAETEPALKKIRLTAEGAKYNKTSSKVKTAGTFALGAVAGSLAFMGALIALPDSVFF